MRKLVFIAFIALGALLGLLSAAQDGWGTRLVMMGIGVLFGAPIGAAIAGLKGKGRKSDDWPEELTPGSVTSSRELTKNYWRDQGHPPFMKPWEAPVDRHVFDPDRQG